MTLRSSSSGKSQMSNHNCICHPVCHENRERRGKMGCWGMELYWHTVPHGVRSRLEQLFQEGLPAQEITNMLIKEYQNICGDPLDEPLFWFALSDMQWTYGMLLPSVKEQALEWIKIKCREDIPAEPQTIADIWNKKRLCQLQIKISTHLPSEPPKFGKRCYRCPWAFGDVFAYPLAGEQAKERGLQGRYLFIQKIGECTVYPGHIAPIVYVKLSNGVELPIDADDYNHFAYVQTGCCKYERRFWPIDMRRPQEDAMLKSQLACPVDDYGLLPEYRVILHCTSRKSIPAELIYAGNFSNAVPPTGEFFPHSDLNLPIISWGGEGATFERELLTRYYGHNLQEYPIYANGPVQSERSAEEEAAMFSSLIGES